MSLTPQEQFEYKNKWKPGFTVRLHSDLDTQGKTWCKQNLEPHQWDYTRYTTAYGHTFHFEQKKHATKFAKQWPLNQAWTYS
jgi:hypothetical protein